MFALIGPAILALAGHSVAQLTGRGFPDCNNGPLKNNKVCDTSAGKLLYTSFTQEVAKLIEEQLLSCGRPL